MWLSYSWQYNDNSYFNFDLPPPLPLPPSLPLALSLTHTHTHTQPFITLNLLTWHKELFVSLELRKCLELSNEQFSMTAGSLFD
jgi:hypothetical protein